MWHLAAGKETRQMWIPLPNDGSRSNELFPSPAGMTVAGHRAKPAELMPRVYCGSTPAAPPRSGEWRESCAEATVPRWPRAAAARVFIGFFVLDVVILPANACGGPGG
jgi:hypothetical protein